VQIFNTDKEYRHFESLLLEGVELMGMRILSYCIMPNHWHLVLYPRNDGDMGNDDWVGDMVEKYNLGSTIRGPGRPKII